MTIPVGSASNIRQLRSSWTQNIGESTEEFKFWAYQFYQGSGYTACQEKTNVFNNINTDIIDGVVQNMFKESLSLSVS